MVRKCQKRGRADVVTNVLSHPHALIADMPRDMTRLVRKATSQFGLLTVEQLRKEGVTKSCQATLVRQGMLETIRPGVVRIMGAPDCWEQQLGAVTLTSGTPLGASHRSALRLWDLRNRFEGLEVSVRYPGNRRLPGVIVHRSVDLIERDLTVVKGIRVTSVARTICDAGLIFPPSEVQRITDHAVATGLVSPAELMAVRRRVGEHGRNGVVKLEGAVEGLPKDAGDADSGPEVELLRVLEKAGLPTPARQYSVTAAGNQYYIDLCYPEARVALEYDGVDPHTRFDRFVDDRRRQNDLVTAGWTVLRYTKVDLRDRREALVAQVRRNLRHL